MKRDHIILLAVVILLLTGAGVAVAYTQKQIRDALWVAFDAAGLPGDWGVALGAVESGWVMTAVNMTGGDLARGGAWGPTQITEKTARAHGYKGPMSDLNKSLSVMAGLSAVIAKAGRPSTLADLGAWWNAGRFHAADLPEGHVTLTTYIPRLLAAHERIS